MQNHLQSLPVIIFVLSFFLWCHVSEILRIWETGHQSLVPSLTVQLTFIFNKCLHKTSSLFFQILNLGLSLKKSYPRLRLQGWPFTFLGQSLSPLTTASGLPSFSQSSGTWRPLTGNNLQLLPQFLSLLLRLRIYANNNFVKHFYLQFSHSCYKCTHLRISLKTLLDI